MITDNYNDVDYDNTMEAVDRRVPSIPRTNHSMKKRKILNSVLFLVSDASSDLPWYLKIQWILFNVSTLTAVAITLLYYSLLSLGQYETNMLVQWTSPLNITKINP